MFKFLLLFLSLFAFSANAQAQRHVVLSEANSLVLNDYVYAESVNKVIQKAQYLDTTFPNGGPIYLVLYTGGGSIVDGIDLIQALNGLKRPVHTIVIHAYSMGFTITQHLGQRYILEQGNLMQHNASGQFRGEFPGQVNNQLNYWVRKIYKLEEATARRTGKSVKHLRAMFDNEYWCTGADCIKAGFADHIITASCDHTLTGTQTQTDKIPLGIDQGKVVNLVITAEMAKCPLSPNPSKVELSLDGGNPFGGVSEKVIDNEKFQKFSEFLESRKTPEPRTWLRGNPLK